MDKTGPVRKRLMRHCQIAESRTIIPVIAVILIVAVVATWLIISLLGEEVSVEVDSSVQEVIEVEEVVTAARCDQFPERLRTCTPFMCESAGESIIL